MSDKIDIAAFERDRDRSNLEFERSQRETEWRRQFEEKMKEETPILEAMNKAKPSWQEDLKPVLQSVVAPAMTVQPYRAPAHTSISTPTPRIQDASASASDIAPFGFIERPLDGGDVGGEIYYWSKLYIDTSLATQAITGLQNPGTEDGWFQVSSGDIIYLKITQNSSAVITAASIECDNGGWADYPAMFELDAGDDYIQYIYITLHQVIADDSGSDAPRPGVFVSNGGTTLKVARVWSGDMDASGIWAENGLLARRPLRYGG